MTDEPRHVVHIVPFDLARGAQRYAQALVDVLQGRDGLTHRLITIFRAESAALRPDVALDVPRGMLRRIGFDPRAMSRLRREIESRRPMAVVAHGGEAAKYAAFALPADVPLIYLRIGTAAGSLLRNPLRRAVHGRYIRRADMIVGVSSDVVAETGRDFGIEPERLAVIPNARDPAGFSTARFDHDGGARLIFVGHLNEGKRPDWFVDIVSELRRLEISVQALLVGDGPLESRLISEAENLGIEMLGRRDDVPDLLASSEVFVFTSLPPGEGMPGVLIEAGMAGLATVSTDVPGARDVIEDGVSGIVVDVHNKQGLVAAVASLARDRSLRESMGQSARERCMELFTFEATSRLWLDVFRRFDGVGSGGAEG